MNTNCKRLEEIIIVLKKELPQSSEKQLHDIAQILIELSPTICESCSNCINLTSIIDEAINGSNPPAELPSVISDNVKASKIYFTLLDVRKAILAIAKGDLSVSLPHRGFLAGTIKALQSSLRHLSWQAQSIADGDLTQHVDFMGDLADAFNKMVANLNQAREMLITKNIDLQNEISERNKIEEKLKISEELHRTIISVSPDGIIITDNNNTIIKASPSAVNLFNYQTEEELIGINITELLCKRDKSTENPYDAYFVYEKEELDINRNNGSIVIVEANKGKLTDLDGNGIGFVINLRDITSRKILEDELKFLSYNDKLTGLYNRRYFESELNRLSKSRNYPISIVAADADGLKSINDNLGHSAGDVMLISISDILKSSFRPEDIISRTGGDEFNILLPGINHETTVQIVNRLRNNIQLFNDTDPEIKVSLSIGFATANEKDSLDKTLLDADTLMYEDKITRKANRR
jgi:diguanylate cyclase (GGDEF)-like protein/PAS domain S-box-containing protein